MALAGDTPTKVSLESSNEQHAAIVDAIREKDPDRARTEMVSHVRVPADILIGLRIGMLD